MSVVAESLSFAFVSPNVVRERIALHAGLLVALATMGGRGGATVRLSAAARADSSAYDAELLVRLNQGDEGAFTEIVHRTAAPLFAYAHSFLGTPDAAHDLVQDVFVDLWDRRGTIVITDTWERHLFGAARFRALHVLRRRRLEDRYLTTGSDLDAAPSDDLLLERADLYAAAIRAARTLPPRAAAVFTLRWTEGLSYAAIAARLGISIKGVENQMTRALRAIRRQLEGDPG